MSLNDVYILCAVTEISLSNVGRPDIPSDRLSIARLESSADTPSPCRTFGNLLSVSNRLIAASIEDANVLKAAFPISTKPRDVANVFILPAAPLDSLPTRFIPSSASPAPWPARFPADSRFSKLVDATSTCFPSTSISILIVPSAAIFLTCLFAHKKDTPLWDV